MKTKLLIISFLIVALLGAFCFKSLAQSKDSMTSAKVILFNCFDYSKDMKDTANNWPIRILTNKTGHIISSIYLIADETELIMPLNEDKTEAKITCDNEKVFNELFKSHGTLFKRFTCTWKSDRYGRYKHYVVYLSKGDAELIKSWAKINL